ncbi:MAG: hypothetical protein M3436_13830 [Pseudomonadota bacterium]|nr:hypothetical protein [Pseudomonadota bacterium]
MGNIESLIEIMARLRDPERGCDPNAVVSGADQQSAAWEAHKTKERAAKNAASILDGIASALPNSGYRRKASPWTTRRLRRWMLCGRRPSGMSRKKEGAIGALEDQKEEAQSNRLVLS